MQWRRTRYAYRRQSCSWSHYGRSLQCVHWEFNNQTPLTILIADNPSSLHRNHKFSTLSIVSFDDCCGNSHHYELLIHSIKWHLLPLWKSAINIFKWFWITYRGHTDSRSLVVVLFGIGSHNCWNIGFDVLSCSTLRDTFWYFFYSWFVDRVFGRFICIVDTGSRFCVYPSLRNRYVKFLDRKCRPFKIFDSWWIQMLDQFGTGWPGHWGAVFENTWETSAWSWATSVINLAADRSQNISIYHQQHSV